MGKSEYCKTTIALMLLICGGIPWLAIRSDRGESAPAQPDRNSTLEAIEHFLTDYTGLPDGLKKDPELKLTHMVGGERENNWTYNLTLKKASPETNPEIGYNEAIGIILAHAKEHLESENPAAEAEFSVVFGVGETPATLTLELKHKDKKTEQTTAPAAVGIVTIKQLASPSPNL